MKRYIAVLHKKRTPEQGDSSLFHLVSCCRSSRSAFVMAKCMTLHCSPASLYQWGHPSTVRRSGRAANRTAEIILMSATGRHIEDLWVTTQASIRAEQWVQTFSAVVVPKAFYPFIFSIGISKNSSEPTQPTQRWIPADVYCCLLL